jgi:phosphatidate cytidylyltransferase
VSAAIGHAGGYLLAAGIVVLLVTATVTGWILKLRFAKGELSATIDNLNARVHSWWIIAAAFALALWSGRTGVIVLFAWASLVAFDEFCGFPRTRAERVTRAASCWIALPVQYMFVWLEWHAAFTIFLPLYAVLVVPFVRMLCKSSPDLKSSVGVLLCIYAISYVPALAALEIPGHDGRDLVLIAFLIVITQLSDVLQYLWGKLLGRHAIARKISPGKTVEGTLGGIACAAALGALLAPLTPFSVGQASAIALTITILGFLGGLLLSAIKRSRGIKDWSALIPGHGGILDRLDSVVLSGPFFFFLVYFGWAR